MRRALAILLSLAMLFALAGCAAPAQEEPQQTAQAPADAAENPGTDVQPATAPKFQAGSYTGTTDGFGGPITLEFVLSENAIESVTVVESSETLGIGQLALEKLTAQVVEYQSIGLDSVSGATVTSTAFFAVAEDCLSQAGGDLEALKKPVERAVSTEVSRLEADVVVVGAGLSGLCSAVSAVENGASVIVLEKLAVTGGSAKASLGSYLICEVPENEGYHVSEEEDTLDAAMERWMDYQANSVRVSPYPDEERLKEQLVQSMFTIGWLETQGASFTPKSPIAERGMAMAQGDVVTDSTDGRAAAKILNRLKAVAEEKGVQIYTETPATELIEENGVIAGVRADSPSGPVEVRARNVILASGGFACNGEMFSELIPEIPEVFTISSVGNTGDGIAMAQAVGAAVFEDAWVNPCWPAPANAFHQANPNATVFQYSNSPIEGVSEDTYHRLMVDKEGNRFMNEAAHYALQILTLARLEAGPYWSLYNGLTGVALEIAESGLSTGAVVKGSTIEEVAQTAGVDPVNLQKSVDAYNAACEAGEDGEFGKSAEYLDKPIGEGPYYMIQIIPACSDTLGGVKTNSSRQVLREDGSVIEGLYAVGAMSNKYYYNQLYFSGSALTFSSTDGRIAGAHAAGVEDPMSCRPAA